MKPIRTVLATAVLAGTAGLATAIPYASGITVGSTTVTQSVGTAITYTLNHAAATVTIEIRDSGDSIVATFPGTTTAGINTVNWDGTNNNSGGTPVAVGAGYRVRVAATGTEAAGWARYAANGASTSGPVVGDSDLVDNWFPKGLAVATDPDSDFFGSAMVGFGYGANLPVAAVVELRADLKVKAGDNGLASRVLRHPGDDETLPNPSSYSAWSLHWDSSNLNLLWWTGQTTSGNAGAKEYMKGLAVGGVMPQFASDGDPNNIQTNGLLPRGIAIHEYDSTRYAFVSRGNGVVEVFTIDSNDEFATAVGNILDAEFTTATRYSRTVRFDSAGNMYWVNQRVGSLTTTANGRVYRWDADDVKAAIANPGTAPLTTANADWIINNDLATRQRVAMVGFAPNGDVYVISSAHGGYNVGNISTGTLNVNLSSLTLAFDKDLIRSSTQNVSDGTTDMMFDAVGNLIVTDGGGENIVALSPGGASSNAFTAPPSQTFEITATSSVGNWMILDN